jgi:hypothetical protein
MAKNSYAEDIAADLRLIADEGCPCLSTDGEVINDAADLIEKLCKKVKKLRKKLEMAEMAASWPDRY